MQRSSKPGFIPELEATRGIAALIVAGFHVSQTKFKIGDQEFRLMAAARDSAFAIEAALADLFHPFLLGIPAVWYFFVLSGFVLAASLARDVRPIPASAWRFAVRRLCRIYPTIIAVILAFAALYFTTGLALQPTYGFVEIVSNMLLLTNTIDGVTWSMQAEVLATPVIFLGFVFWRRGSTVALFALAVILTSLSFSGDWNRLMGRVSITEPLYAFVFGVITYATGRRVVERVDPRYHGLCMAGAVLVFFYAGPVLGSSKYVMVAKITAAAVLIGFLAFGQNRTASRMLGVSAVRFLGRVSYSFYLLHPLTLTVIWHQPTFFGTLVKAGIPTGVLILGLSIASTLAVLPLAYLSYRFVELPGIALGRRLCRMGGAGGSPRPASGALNPSLSVQAGRPD